MIDRIPFREGKNQFDNETFFFLWDNTERKEVTHLLSESVDPLLISLFSQGEMYAGKGQEENTSDSFASFLLVVNANAAREIDRDNDC